VVVVPVPEQILDVVGFAADIRWVEVEQGVGGITAGQHVAPVEVFEHNAFEPRVGRIEDRLQPREAEPSRPFSCHPEHTIDLPTEGQTLQVEEPGRALQVRERGRIAFAQPIELAPRCDLVFHHIQKLRIVSLDDAKQVGDLAVQIICDFAFRLPRAA